MKITTNNSKAILCMLFTSMVLPAQAATRLACLKSYLPQTQQGRFVALGVATIGVLSLACVVRNYFKKPAAITPAVTPPTPAAAITPAPEPAFTNPELERCVRQSTVEAAREHFNENAAKFLTSKHPTLIASTIKTTLALIDTYFIEAIPTKGLTQKLDEMNTMKNALDKCAARNEQQKQALQQITRAKEFFEFYFHNFLPPVAV